MNRVTKAWACAGWLAMAACSCEEKPVPSAPSAPSAAEPAKPTALETGIPGSLGEGAQSAKGDGGALTEVAGAPSATKGDAGLEGAGEILGVVVFDGAAPEAQPLKRGVDPVCGKTPMNDETVLVNGGKLVNVVVRLQGAIAGKASEGPVVVDQNQCMYRPRVQAAMRGQGLVIKNSDATLHNIHSYEGTKTMFNQAQPSKGAPVEKKFDFQGVLRLKCDVHPWMTGYVVFSENPYFATTGADGAFKISGVPAGTYTVEAWHEKLGKKSAQVTVSAGAPAQVSFSYRPEDRG